MEQRIKRIQEILNKDDAALIMSDTNRLYFTGFKSSAGVVLITKREAFLLIDFRYIESARQNVKHMNVLLAEKLYSQIAEILKANEIKNLILETGYITLESFKTLKSALGDFNISDDNVLSRKISNLRSIKDSREIEFIKKAQALTDQTFEYALSIIKNGITEKELALNMEFFMRQNGSEGTAFDFIAVSGKNSSLPHGVPTDKRIENGDFITMDFGAIVGGYRSDMTRTVALGFVNDRQHEVYETVLKAQLTALQNIKSGTECCKIDKIARDIITDAGYGKCFGHGLGHSVGLEIHENPACNTRDKTLLKSGMIMTVEPGIYIENSFGVRIEDMVVVTDSGCINLTKSPKELIVL